MRKAIRREEQRIDNQVWGLLPEDFTGWSSGAPGADGDSPAEAELIADRGAAAESEEFFRSRPFLDAEGSRIRSGSPPASARHWCR